MEATQLKCPSCGSTDLEKLKWNEYRCSHCGSGLRLDSEGKRLELAVWACPECGFGNAVGQRFCSQCGTKLTKACPRCRIENYLDVQYCGSCGFAFKLWKAYSQLEGRLASLRQWLAQLQAHQAARRAAQRRESESSTMTLLKAMGFLILLPLFPLWPIWLFWKQQEQKKEETLIAQLTSRIEELELIRTGSPSQLEEWVEERQRRIVEEKQRAEERRRQAEEKRKAEEKQRQTEEAARKRIPPEREAKVLRESLQQWFKRQSEWSRFAIVAGVLLLLLCLCICGIFPPTPKPTPTPVPTSTPRFTPTRTPRPTSTPRPPTSTPMPTNTPEPPPTPTFSPPTATPVPTLTLEEQLAQLAQRLHELWAEASKDDAPAEKWESVIVLIEQILAINPNYDDMVQKLYAAHVNYGLQLAAESRREEAKMEFTRALEIKPNGVEAAVALAVLVGETPRPLPDLLP